MNRLTKIKKILVSVLIMSIMLSITGCNGPKGDSGEVYTEKYASETSALKVGNEDISVAEAVINLIINYKSFGITPDKMSTDGAQATSLALSNIREYNIIYQKAIAEGYSATPGDAESIDKVTESFISEAGDIMKIYGITRKNVHEVFYKQLIYSNYQNDRKLELSKRMYDGYLEALKDKRFVELYQVSFPLVQVDSEGNIKTDENGNMSSVTDAEKTDAKANADAAYKEIESGSTPESVAKKYEVEKYSQSLNGFVGGFSDEINKAVENLENDEFTNVIETDKAYVILYMKNNNDEAIKAGYAMSLVRENIDEKFESEKQSMLSDVNISEDDLKEWGNIDTKLLAEKIAETK